MTRAEGKDMPMSGWEHRVREQTVPRPAGWSMEAETLKQMGAPWGGGGGSRL